jgi:type II secretory pathway component PulM
MKKWIFAAATCLPTTALIWAQISPQMMVLTTLVLLWDAICFGCLITQPRSRSLEKQRTALERIYRR